jgi:hypothetical protein
MHKINPIALLLVQFGIAAAQRTSLKPLIVPTPSAYSVSPMPLPTAPVAGSSAPPPEAGGNQVLASGVESSLPLGAVIGIALGSLVLLLGIIALGCLLSWKRREVKRGLKVDGLTQDYDPERKLASWQREKKKANQDDDSDSGNSGAQSDKNLVVSPESPTVDLRLPIAEPIIYPAMTYQTVNQPFYQAHQPALVPIQPIPQRTESRTATFPYITAESTILPARRIDRMGTPASVASSTTVGVPSSPPTPSRPVSQMQQVTYYTRDVNGNLIPLNPLPQPQYITTFTQEAVTIQSNPSYVRA